VLLAVFLVGIAGAWGWQWYRQQLTAQAPLPVIGTVGDFTLVERSGQTFGLSELKGRIWIVNFFFSNCTMVCPRTMPQLARLQSTVAEEVLLVSITVDPENDTPAVLTEFAEHFDAQAGRWYFLTGEQQAIYDLSLNTFHMAVEAVPEGQHQHSGDAFVHDAHFVLVDRQAQIRGYYDGLDDEAVAHLVNDLQVLLKEK
jgi:cytochrome oxidase Cu insertion factor (SCO1/SenC/PrrC family)